MQDLQQELVSLGLNETEARLYLGLLKSGTQPFSLLQKKFRLPKKKFEELLVQLEKRGIISRARSGKNLFFTAEDPKKLAELLADEERRVAAKKESLAKLVEPLRSLGVRASASPVVHFFTGAEGARAALEDSLKAKEKTLRVFFSVADFSDFLGADFLDQYAKRRVSAGLSLHAVRTFEREKPKAKKTRHAQIHLSSREEKREVRFVSEDLAFPMTLFLYDQKLLGLASKEENFAFIIESKELAQMQKKLFDLTWRSLAIRSMPA